jgi:hypothetical protein
LTKAQWDNRNVRNYCDGAALNNVLSRAQAGRGKARIFTGSDLEDAQRGHEEDNGVSQKSQEQYRTDWSIAPEVCSDKDVTTAKMDNQTAFCKSFYLFLSHDS